MKGEMKIEVDGECVTCKGNILFSNDVEPYFVLHSVAKCLCRTVEVGYRSEMFSDVLAK